MLPLRSLPTLNAFLNATSALFLLAGYAAIKRKHINLHRTCMMAALTSSACFLASYLTYHIQMGTTRFLRTGWIRPTYFTILLTHTILAVVILPLVFITVRRAWKGRFDRHVRIARWTWPLWMYVSVTGVVIYLILYHFPAS